MKALKRQSNAALVREIYNKLFISNGHIRVVKGQIRVYKGFFLCPKMSEEEWAKNIESELIVNGFTNLVLERVDGNHYMPFRGGCPVHKNSHYCAVFNRVD